MAILQWLKSLLGLDSGRDPHREHRRGGSTASQQATRDDTSSQQPTETADTADRESPAGTDETVEVIEGIGPAYSERLAAADVATVADLAAADAQELAEKTDISPARIERWIERAKARS